MASEHTVADDIVYDLISIQYHALKAAEVYDKFLEDLNNDDSPVDLPDAGGDPMKGFNDFGPDDYIERITIASSVRDMDEF